MLLSLRIADLVSHLILPGFIGDAAHLQKILKPQICSYKYETYHREHVGLHLPFTQTVQRITCALRTTLSRLGDGSSAGRRWADEWQTSDGTSDTRAALAGVVEGGCEGVTVRVHDTLIQTRVTDGAAGLWGDRMWAPDWTRSPLTVHHLILIKGRQWGKENMVEGIKRFASSFIQMFCFRSVRLVRLTRQEHEEQGSEGEEKVEPDWYSLPWCRHTPVQTGQHSPGGVTGRTQATLGQDARVHTTPPFYT